MSQANLDLFMTDEYLYVKLGLRPPVRWVGTITAVSDRDADGRLYGTELFLYEEPSIDLQKVRGQFQNCAGINTEEDGLLYLQYRDGEMAARGPGFGRGAYIGIDLDGRLSAVRIPWTEPKAATPAVDARAALAGLNFAVGEPIW